MLGEVTLCLRTKLRGAALAVRSLIRLWQDFPLLEFRKKIFRKTRVYDLHEELMTGNFFQGQAMSGFNLQKLDNGQSLKATRAGGRLHRE